MHTVLDYCLRTAVDLPCVSSNQQWRLQWQAQTKGVDFSHASVAAAVYVGFHADSVAWAFLTGYQAAVRKLLSPDDIDVEIAPDAIVSFSVSEQSGNRPRDIKTSIDTQPDGTFLVNGAKTWVVAGEGCDWLILSGVNRASPHVNPSDKLDIRLMAASAKDPGVSFIENPPTQFIPEVKHSGARFEQLVLPATRLLPGNGHERYVKPFRTLEDIHIAAAILSYLVRCARVHQWPASVIENNLSLIVGLDALSHLDPGAPQTHLALTGLLVQVNQAYETASACWFASTDAEESARKWERDSALFSIASKTRQARAERAWSALRHK